MLPLSSVAEADAAGVQVEPGVSRPFEYLLAREAVLPGQGRQLFPRAGVEAYRVAEHRRRESVLASMAPWSRRRTPLPGRNDQLVWPYDRDHTMVATLASNQTKERFLGSTPPGSLWTYLGLWFCNSQLWHQLLSVWATHFAHTPRGIGCCRNQRWPRQWCPHVLVVQAARTQWVRLLAG